LSDRIFQGCLFLRKINVPLIYYSFYKRCFKRLEKCICFL
jgi:hypothetical protein